MPAIRTSTPAWRPMYPSAPNHAPPSTTSSVRSRSGRERHFMRGKPTFFAVLFVLACLLPSPASAGVDDLVTLYALARSKDPAIGRSQARLDASRADKDIALAQLFPRVDA